MNLSKLFEIQKQLDERIVKEKGLEEIRNRGIYELNNALKTEYAWIADEARAYGSIIDVLNRKEGVKE